MLAFVIRRLLWMIPVLFFITLIIIFVYFPGSRSWYWLRNGHGHGLGNGLGNLTNAWLFILSRVFQRRSSNSPI